MEIPMPNPTRAHRNSLEQGRALIDALIRSGMTAAAYARSNNLDPRRISFWKRRLRASDQVGDKTPNPSAFIQIEPGTRPVPAVCKDVWTFTVHAQAENS
jgi:hypothetical protein